MMDFFSFPSSKENNVFQGGFPSFVKFAAKIGVTLQELENFCKEHEEFASAYKECEARLFDILTDGVLTKRLDASFVRALLQEKEKNALGNNGENEPFSLTLTVVQE